jgi:hypothetical protein
MQKRIDLHHRHSFAGSSVAGLKSVSKDTATMRKGTFP